MEVSTNRCRECESFGGEIEAGIFCKQKGFSLFKQKLSSTGNDGKFIECNYEVK